MPSVSKICLIYAHGQQCLASTYEQRGQRKSRIVLKLTPGNIVTTPRSDMMYACDKADITVTLPKPVTSGVKAKGRFGKHDFRYVAADDVYIWPAGERLRYHFTNEEHGLRLRRYWTNACQRCAIKARCTTGAERRITRWEHEDLLEEVQ